MSTDTSDPTVREQPATYATGPETSTLLQTEGLVKRFGGFTAIDGVDFDVAEGELHCLIGPNGAGKSTLLKLLTGTHDPTAGRIYYDGFDVTNLDPHERVRRGMSIKFQVPSVYENFSVRENLRIPLQRDGHDLHDAVDAHVDRFDLGAVADTVAGNLSHGQQQRLEIGMAAALDPDLLLLDEPVAGLSVDERQEIAATIRGLNDDGIAFVVIEHDIDFVEAIADRVTVLDRGQVFRQGTIDEVAADTDVQRIYLGGER